MAEKKQKLSQDASWVLTRLDDNGNEFEISRFNSEHEAQAMKKDYESRGHKQAYFVKKCLDTQKPKNVIN